MDLSRREMSLILASLQTVEDYHESFKVRGELHALYSKLQKRFVEDIEAAERKEKAPMDLAEAMDRLMKSWN